MSEVRTSYPLLGEVVGVVLQNNERSKNISERREIAAKRCLDVRHTYNFHALPAGRLRNGVLDETVRGKRLQGHRKGN